MTILAACDRGYQGRGKVRFSGWRGAIDQARLRFRQMQQWLIGALHRPAWIWKVRQWQRQDAALADLMARVADPFAHRWNAPGWSYIEPLKDAAADELQDTPAAITAFTADTGLFGHLPELDSMAVAGLLTEVEDRLDIVIEDDEVDGEMLETYGGLLAFVRAKRNEG